MTAAVLDDHLLRDLLSGDISAGLADVLAKHQPTTTNLYLVRLCRSVVSGQGGKLTAGWTTERRQALGRRLLVLPQTMVVVALRSLAFRVAELADLHRLSTLGAEAIAAAEHLGAPLVVWDGDDGPSIRTAASILGIGYLRISR